MEQYYDQKWNSEYKKVKMKLENHYNSKLDQLEKEGLANIVHYQRTIRELIQEKEDYAQQLIEMGKLYRIEQADKIALQ
jgi:fructose-1,6-bisphosphatase